MGARPLRRNLALQGSLVALVPFAVMASLVAARLFPQVRAEVEAHHQLLARTVAQQIESYLEASLGTVQGFANLLQHRHLTQRNLQDAVSALVESSRSLRAVYVVDARGRVSLVGLAGSNARSRQDLEVTDLSRNELFRQVTALRRPTWSDTFLSVVGGGLSVAVAVPAGGQFVFGEVDLGRLSDYLGRISVEDDQVVLVLDHRGQVIADREGLITAQQLNIGNIPLVRRGLEFPGETTGRLELEGRRMIGSLAGTPRVPWHVLVARPAEIAYLPIRTSVAIGALGFATALLAGVLASVWMARRLARRFEALAAHARRIARGDAPGDWPASNVREFRQLGDDLRQMSDAIRERERQLTTLAAAVEQAEDQIVITDEGGSIRYVNPAAERGTGFSAHELSGTWMLPLRDGPEGGEVNREIWDVLRAGQSWKGRFSAQGKDGRKILYDSSIAPIRDARGAIVGFVAAQRDVTVQEEMERRAMQSQQLEAIGTLAGGIAHDFNNILSAIVGYTELSLMGELPEPLRKNLEAVLTASNRAADLVRQILAFSRVEPRGETTAIQAAPIVKEALKLLRASIPATVEIRQSIACDASVSLAPADLHRIVVNLCTNAALAVGERPGEVEVRLDEVELDGAAAALHPAVEPGPFVRLTVRDNGCGMAPDVKARIFEPFFTTRPNGQGTGMGLSVVHGIVTSRKGGVSVKSEPGRGSTFEVLLPATRKTENRPAAVASHASGGTERVLFVDDEPSISGLAADALGALGYRVRAFTSPLEALQAFREAPDSFDLVVTDMTMPGMTGESLTQQLRAVRSDIPVILCTGYSERINAEKAQALGIDDFLSKPVPISRLAEAIRRAARRLEASPG